MGFDQLKERMKGYEQVSRNYLIRRTPVIIRIDGKAFHTFTKGLKKPFDDIIVTSMQETMKYLCENVQGCVLGYTQSDEISLLLTDYATFETDAWFGYNVQKLTSISASMATMMFNKIFNVNRPYNNTKIALFDSRAFNLSKEEVTNYFYWRQKDAIRNSIEAMAQSVFSAKELHGKNQLDMINMLSNAGHSWFNLVPQLRKGSCCIKVDGKWIIDNNIPLWEKDKRDYVESRFDFEEKKEETNQIVEEYFCSVENNMDRFELIPVCFDTTILYPPMNEMAARNSMYFDQITSPRNLSNKDRYHGYIYGSNYKKAFERARKNIRTWIEDLYRENAKVFNFSTIPDNDISEYVYHNIMRILDNPNIFVLCYDTLMELSNIAKNVTGTKIYYVYCPIIQTVYQKGYNKESYEEPKYEEYLFHDLYTWRKWVDNNQDRLIK